MEKISARIFTVVCHENIGMLHDHIVEPSENERWQATWQGPHHTNGLTVMAESPQSALRELALAMDVAEARQQVINDIDAEEDP